MNSENYKFKVGDFECVAINDGSMNYPVELFFSNAPMEEITQILRQRNLTTEHVHTPYTCLYIDTGQHRVIVDTGAGDIAESAHKFFPSIDNSSSVTGKLYDNMIAAGIAPAEVDTVIITHAHPDHVAGILTSEEKLAFKNAQYYIARAEYKFWMSDEAESKASPPMIEIARRCLSPLEGRLVFLEGHTEILPGISVLPTPGHTPGHIAVEISSDGEELLNVSDAVLYPLHLEYPDWLPGLDTIPGQAAISKQRIFDRAAGRKAKVFAHHFPPFPSVGYVKEKTVGWEWQPVEIF